MGYPEGSQLSPDGNYWWDGQAWQPVPGGPADVSSSSASSASAGPSSAHDAAGGAATPTDAASEQALAAQVNESDVQSMVQQIAAASSIASSPGVDQLNTSASDPSQMSGDEVRARCATKCDLYLDYDGEVFALTDCGDGTCPTCPPGFGNLIVRNWCAYRGVSTHRDAIVLHLAFGATLGPFIV